jgi:hypothetical protein
MEPRSLIEPPRFATWLLSAALPAAESDAIAGDLCEEFRDHVAPHRGIHRARWWYCWQVTRSLTPLLLRSWQRATLTRASLAIATAAFTAIVPAMALLFLRSFVLSQVPLKTSAELSSVFAGFLFMVVAATIVLASAIAIRLLNVRR